jgi:hypothetical protein
MLESELTKINTDIEDVTIIHPVKKAYRNLPLRRTGKSDNSLSEFTMSKPTSETTLESESMPIDSDIEDVTVVDPVKKAETEGNDYPPLRHTGKSDNSPSEFTMSRHTSETTLESKRMLIDPESEPERESVSLEVADHEYDEAIGDNDFILEEDDSELTPHPTKKGDKYYFKKSEVTAVTNLSKPHSHCNKTNDVPDRSWTSRLKIRKSWDWKLGSARERKR